MSHHSETLFNSSEVLVRLMVLDPNEVGQKHYHLHVHVYETVICVEGEIAMFVAGNALPQILIPGKQVSVPSSVVHWLQNRGAKRACYILAQCGGEYDFLPA